jgi:hypothetical protein
LSTFSLLTSVASLVLCLVNRFLVLCDALLFALFLFPFVIPEVSFVSAPQFELPIITFAQVVSNVSSAALPSQLLFSAEIVRASLSECIVWV